MQQSISIVSCRDRLLFTPGLNCSCSPGYSAGVFTLRSRRQLEGTHVSPFWVLPRTTTAPNEVPPFGVDKVAIAKAEQNVGSKQTHKNMDAMGILISAFPASLEHSSVTPPAPPPPKKNDPEGTWKSLERDYA